MNNREIFIDKLRQLSKEEMLERYIALLNTEKLTDYVSDLEAKLAEKDRRLRIIDEFKNNYGYTNYEDEYMLEDLQSRAYQAEDDTEIIESLLDYFNINDENEILTKVKSQLAEKDKEIERLNKLVKKFNNEAQKYFEDAYCNGFQNQKAIEQLEKLKYTININQIDNGYTDEQVDLYELNEIIDQQINELKETPKK